MDEIQQKSAVAGVIGGCVVLVFAGMFAAAAGVGVSLFGALGGGIAQGLSQEASACVAAHSSSGRYSAGPSSARIPEEYREDVKRAAERTGLSQSMIYYQIFQESGWDPSKTNASSGAMGLAQFMPATWSAYGHGADAYNGHDALDAYGRFMADVRDQVSGLAGGDEEKQHQLMLAAYNWGPGNVLAAGGDFSGVPETSQYVSNIVRWTAEDQGLAGQGKSSSAVSVTDENISDPSRCTSGARGTPVQDGHTSGNDDYPWKDMAYCDASYSSCPSEPDPTNALPRECVAFAAWRVNQQLGGDENNIKFHSPSNAVGWQGYWDSRGWSYGSKPVVGAVVYYADGAGGSNPTYGHVAVVKEVREDGTFVEEGYNGLAAPNDHQYYTREVSNDTPTSFLYIHK